MKLDFQPIPMRVKYGAFFYAVRNLRAAKVKFNTAGDYQPNNEQMIDPDVPLEDANVISSELNAKGYPLSRAYHHPCLDIDIPHLYMPSSTPGHAHLIFETTIDWERYQRLLTVLAECGIIEHNYARVSIAKGASYLRVPWVKKGDE